VVCKGFAGSRGSLNVFDWGHSTHFKQCVEADVMGHSVAMAQQVYAKKENKND
jgi:hypothetical protein